MAMAKESRSIRTGKQDIQAPASKKAKADIRPAGDGSELFTINEQGEYCFGTSCFSMRVKPDSSEIRVVVDRNECGADAQLLVDTLFGAVIKGIPTVYETKSKKS